MPQKTRSQKERAAAKRETGQFKRPIAPAPIATEADVSDSGLSLRVPQTPKRRAANVVAQPLTEADFDYSYVYADLRRIGLLAILCFAVMIALAFVVQAEKKRT